MMKNYTYIIFIIQSVKLPNCANSSLDSLGGSVLLPAEELVEFLENKVIFFKLSSKSLFIEIFSPNRN